MSAQTDADGFRLCVAETTAESGDVFLCHASAPNVLGVPRFMCNRTTPLKERMNFQRDDGTSSPVELSIRKALKRA